MYTHIMHIYIYISPIWRLRISDRGPLRGRPRPSCPRPAPPFVSLSIAY